MHNEPMTTASTTYERITYRPEDAPRARSVILRNPRVTDRFTTGIEVTSEGDEIAPAGADERLHVIDNALITMRRPMAMDLTYAQLRPVGRAGRAPRRR